jgi:hypothetical protein
LSNEIQMTAAEFAAVEAKLQRLGLIVGPTIESGLTERGLEVARAVLIEFGDRALKMPADRNAQAAIFAEWIVEHGWEKDSILSAREWFVLCGTSMFTYVRARKTIELHDRMRRVSA